MYAQSTLTVLLAAAAGLASALPATAATRATRTPKDLPARTVPLTGVTHTVVAGLGGALVFDPNNVVAEVGDIVEWHYLPKNHSVAQSSFGSPCQPLADANGNAVGFFSGFQPTAEGQAPDVFQIVVENTNPTWYYCAQTVGNHCQKGMAGVINQNFDSANTLAAYEAAAALTGVSGVPPVVQGGAVIANPNPLGGF
ncbi:extracellular serine-rich protein [Niveomyces insectorum RCEF 264]|uniref:Extracellular serine-rich protein n=1 Tax=Niveomyces insectorum RCEF 264 TaxID=1081102 RepID=A0A167SSR9_9HYPO|nr:extracellular serine-rich protein [Niveomyces insectorum RCEF 264]